MILQHLISSIHIMKYFLIVAKQAPFRIEYYTDGLDVVDQGNTVKGAKVSYWQNSC